MGPRESSTSRSAVIVCVANNRVSNFQSYRQIDFDLFLPGKMLLRLWVNTIYDKHVQNIFRRRSTSFQLSQWHSVTMISQRSRKYTEIFSQSVSLARDRSFAALFRNVVPLSLHCQNMGIFLINLFHHFTPKDSWRYLFVWL